MADWRNIGIGAGIVVALTGIGLAANYLIRGPQIVEQRYTGSTQMNITIGTRVQDRRYYDPVVLFCEGTDNCFPREEFMRRLEKRLDSIEEKALEKARE